MNPTDTPVLKSRLSEMADALGTKAPGESGTKAWFIALKDFAIDDVVDALDQWLRTKPKMPAPADVRLILAGRLSDHIERQSVARKAEFAVGAQRILADPQIARVHLDRCFQVLRKSAPSSDFEWNKERLAIAHQDDPLP